MEIHEAAHIVTNSVVAGMVRLRKNGAVRAEHGAEHSLLDPSQIQLGMGVAVRGEAANVATHICHA